MRAEKCLWALVFVLLFGSCALAEEIPHREIGKIFEAHALFADASLDAPRYFASAKDRSLLDAYLKELDPYASFIPKKERAALAHLNKNLPAGIGMDIFRDRKGRVRCVPYAGMAAEEAGVRYGDEILKVDDISVEPLSLQEIAQVIRGEDGTTVALTVQRKGAPLRTVDCVRKIQGQLPTVTINRLGSRALIRIYRFGPKTAKELVAVLAQVPKDEAVLIDLRGNTGGSLEAAVEATKLFLPKGCIVMRRQTRQRVQQEVTTKDGAWAHVTLALRQDRYTASAAEMMIAALMAAKRCTVHGERSAGKACVQSLFTLSDGSLLKLTTEKLLFPQIEGDWEGRGIDVKELGEALLRN